jgi:hypothetical protein
MRLAPPIVPPAPAREPRAARARVARTGRRWPPGRARGLASVLLGALAGLAAASAIVAAAPVVGRAGTPQATAAAPVGDSGGPVVDPGEESSSVAAVLAPAIEAGLVPASRSEAARP